MKEHDLIVLTHDVRAHSLRRGDIGTIVHVYADGRGIEVEFAIASGDTVAVLTLTPADYRLPEHNEILHVRRV